MRIPQSIGKPCAVFSMLAGAVLFPAAFVQAQSFSDLQNLAFYPTSLESLATGSSADTTYRGTDSSDATHSGSDTTGTAENIKVGFDQSVMGSYLQDIAEARDNAGSYAPELTQKLTSAGLLYQQQHHHEEAVENFERAAESSRIQNGLYSSEQIVLTEHTINSLVALGRSDEAEDKYSQLLNINRKLYGPAAPQTAHALLGLGQLQVERLQHHLAGFDGLQKIQTHFIDAIRMLIASEAWSDPALFAGERNLVRTYYLDAIRAGVLNDPLASALDAESIHSRMRERANRKALPEQYLKGEQAYLRMMDYLKKDPGADITAIADVMLGLADWHLLFGNKPEADEQYRQLEDIMALAGIPADEAAAIMHPAVPVTLPAFVDTALSPKAIADTSLSQGYVDVSFNVNPQGRAVNLEVLGTSDGTGTAVIDHLGNLVRNAQFRPATDASADYSLRYYLSH